MALNPKVLARVHQAVAVDSLGAHTGSTWFVTMGSVNVTNMLAMKSVFLASLLLGVCSAGFAKVQCAVDDGPAFASPVSGSEPSEKSHIAIQKGTRYDVEQARAGWSVVSTAGQKVWARTWLFASSCKPASGGAGKVVTPKGQTSSALSKSFSPTPGSQCPCGSGKVCVGPRGGRYCITSGGNKRYGV